MTCDLSNTVMNLFLWIYKWTFIYFNSKLKTTNNWQANIQWEIDTVHPWISNWCTGIGTKRITAYCTSFLHYLGFQEKPFLHIENFLLIFQFIISSFLMYTKPLEAYVNETSSTKPCLKWYVFMSLKGCDRHSNIGSTLYGWSNSIVIDL